MPAGPAALAGQSVKSMRAKLGNAHGYARTQGLLARVRGMFARTGYPAAVNQTALGQGLGWHGESGSRAKASGRALPRGLLPSIERRLGAVWRLCAWVWPLRASRTSHGRGAWSAVASHEQGLTGGAVRVGRSARASAVQLVTARLPSAAWCCPPALGLLTSRCLRRP
jgi:hypothetical protein